MDKWRGCRDFESGLLDGFGRHLTAQNDDAVAGIDTDDVGRGAFVLRQGIRYGAYNLRIGDQVVGDRIDLVHPLHEHPGDQLLGHGANAAAQADGVAVYVDEDLGVRGAQRFVVPQGPPNTRVNPLFGALQIAVRSTNNPAQLISPSVVFEALVQAPGQFRIPRGGPTRRCLCWWSAMSHC